MYVEACRAKQSARNNNCTDCTQGWDVIHLATQYKMAEREAEEPVPKLIKRRKGPQLIKRRK
jgi:hypothetical protein